MNDLEAWYAWLDTLDAAGRNLAMGALVGALSVSSTEKAWQSALTITRGIVERPAAEDAGVTQ